MATRGNIGILREDGSVIGIYVHWDSYPEHVGELLLNYYSDAEIANELMNLGDLSQLNRFIKDENNPNYVCIAYGRDRGETGTEAKIFANLKSFEEYANKSGAAYQYLYNCNAWMYRKANGVDNKWKDLEIEDCK